MLGSIKTQGLAAVGQEVAGHKGSCLRVLVCCLNHFLVSSLILLCSFVHPQVEDPDTSCRVVCIFSFASPRRLRNIFWHARVGPVLIVCSCARLFAGVLPIYKDVHLGRPLPWHATRVTRIRKDNPEKMLFGAC